MLDLESQTNQKLKEIENLLKGGVTDKKLKHLEENYKNNRDVMEIILSDPDTDAIVKDNDLIIRSSNAGFETARDNQIIEKVEDGYFDELILLGQSLDEITRESTDIIEWEDYQDE